MIDIDVLVNEPVEIQSELEYLFSKKEKTIIFDIGSCTGEDSIRYKKLFPEASLYAFEPLPANIRIMREHFRKFGMEDVHVIDLALSDKNETTSFYVSSGKPHPELKEEDYTTLFPKEWNKSSSLLAPSSSINELFPWLKFQEEIKVETTTLDVFCKERNIRKIDFIHMDVQGAELKVLQGAECMLPNIAALWLEVENVELYDGQPLGHVLHDFLVSKGFVKIKDTSKGQIAGDCLYVNKKHFSFFKRSTISFIKYFRPFKK